MRNLTDVISESLVLDAASKSYNPKTDKVKLKIVGRIDELGLDSYIADELKATSEDTLFNEKVQKMQQAYNDMIQHLEKDGLIQVNGFRIQKLRNI